MNERIEITKRDFVVISLIALTMVGSLVYGYFLLKKDQQKSCWDLYATETSAILHCETHTP